MMSSRYNSFDGSIVPAESSSIHGVSNAVYSRSISDATTGTKEDRHRFKSYRLTGPYEQPWVGDKRMNRTRYNNFIVYGFMFLGLAIAGYICYATAAAVPKHEYCLVLSDTFSKIDSTVWNQEVQLGGFGTGSFEWTTTDPANSYVDSQGLHIVPTLTNLTTSLTSDQIVNGYTLNLTADGTCTSKSTQDCVAVSNYTMGTSLPPVRSARLNTLGKKSIKYGRVEVTAKMPKGDWLWPAIWMMPVDSKYGVWPRSGEIDIAESRGNAISYASGGVDTYSSTLHWGPTSGLDAYWRTSNSRTVRRSDLSQEFHVYGIEWSKNYLYTYIDSKLQQVLYMPFTGYSMWQRGEFASQTVNNTVLVDPWSSTGNLNTPFDQEFYLILNVAVGSRNGWFADGVGAKPWVDAQNQLAARSFWQAADTWLPTWGTKDSDGMVVKSVQMWQEGACGTPSL